mmetsp:Transcript_55410/g.140123  ORF Transcript_55410/g.140123 Transcript_55410/m.140123 type:complete len:203 (+) Transcript_55410:31-639(+)
MLLNFVSLSPFRFFVRSWCCLLWLGCPCCRLARCTPCCRRQAQAGPPSYNSLRRELDAGGTATSNVSSTIDTSTCSGCSSSLPLVGVIVDVVNASDSQDASPSLSSSLTCGGHTEVSHDASTAHSPGRTCAKNLCPRASLADHRSASLRSKTPSKKLLPTCPHLGATTIFFVRTCLLFTKGSEHATKAYVMTPAAHTSTLKP